MEGSNDVLLFKLFKKMKINKKFAKKALLMASLTAGTVGIDSIFNEVQATGGGGGYILSKCYKDGSWNNYQCTPSSISNCSQKSSCS